MRLEKTILLGTEVACGFGTDLIRHWRRPHDTASVTMSSLVSPTNMLPRVLMAAQEMISSMRQIHNLAPSESIHLVPAA